MSKTRRRQLYDAYSRFFRWATDRLGDRDGVICFVTNNGFLEGFAFDGFRKHLAEDFTGIYHLDLGGNARKRGGGSVFNIMVGVGITLLVRRREGLPKPYPAAVIHYHALNDRQTGLAKLAELTSAQSIAGLDWQILAPDAKHNWITEGLHADYSDFLPLVSKEAKASYSPDVQAIFKTYSPGVMTGRDSVVYDFDRTKLELRVNDFINEYNATVLEWKRVGRPKEVDAFVSYEKIKWSRNLKAELTRGRLTEYDKSALRQSLYRPFTKQWIYDAEIIVDERGSAHQYFPASLDKTENSVIMYKVGAELPMFSLMVNIIPDRQPQTGSQCFPLYTYALDGKLRRDNVTDWALGQFQAKYGPDVTKRDIFHYVYGLLHSPEYRERYKENLKRELPRVPLVEDGPLAPNSGGTGEEGRDEEGRGDPAPLAPLELGAGGLSFQQFVSAGAALAALHVGYEQAEEYPLTQTVNKDVPFSWRVAKMRLNKEKTAVVVNEALTLAGIPPEAFEYKLGNRSALEWVLDQYQVGTDKRSGIVSDPNRADDREYIVRLVRRVVTVSVETVRLVAGLPPLHPPT